MLYWISRADWRVQMSKVFVFFEGLTAGLLTVFYHVVSRVQDAFPWSHVGDKLPSPTFWILHSGKRARQNAGWIDALLCKKYLSLGWFLIIKQSGVLRGRYIEVFEKDFHFPVLCVVSAIATSNARESPASLASQQSQGHRATISIIRELAHVSCTWIMFAFAGRGFEQTYQ
ncbi:hypothetical protein B0J12DRAFT_282670 [Macrophomina phaseolina]|uniref:Uncharacterized protein n=1 Tax=Macrophomina phaseolina TaxID=35725 RepID=A0ABQ8GQM9_9PEZI|nr:hypothetical protein B0J12DRAFT_282670 [Macrophomina phaseolina]